MAKSDEVLDRVFRKKLENHQESPRPSAWDKLEAQLEKLLQQKADLEAAISDPETIENEPLLQKVLAYYAAVEKLVDDVETAWIEAQI